jgi:hypothetical protein
MTIVFLAALMLLFKAELYTGPVDTNIVTVQTTNAFRERIENVYIPLVARHHSYITMYALVDNAYTNDRWLKMPDDYRTAMLYGYYRGNGLSDLSLTNATYRQVVLDEAFFNLSEVAKQTGFNVSFIVHNITIEQTGVLQAAYTLNISYNLSSRDGAVSYERNLIQQEKFTLLGLPELGYNRESKARGFGEYVYFYQLQPPKWNNTAFAPVIVNRTYLYNNESPSYFQRIQGQWGLRSPFGVYTVIPTSRTPPANITSFDWKYFTGVETACIYALSPPYPGTHVSYEDIFTYNFTNTTFLAGVSQSNCPPAP